MAGIVIIFGLWVPTSMLFAQAGDNQNPGVFPPDAIVFGKTYGEWSAEWWQWNFSIPVPNNPTFDTAGQHCGVQQSRPVFFLAGIGSPVAVTRKCTVRSETPLFFPLINAECSNVESPPFFGSTDEERLACAQALIDGVGISTLKVTIDGVDVKSLRRFRVESPPFDFKMPAQNNILFLPGVTSGRSTSDGYWLMLKPLSPGTHVIHFEAAFVSGPGAGFSQDVTYVLTVT
jgi:hypothetical protein